MNPQIKNTFVTAQLKTYERIKQGIMNFEKEIPITENCNLTPVMTAVLMDSPELFYVGDQMGVAKSLFDKKIIPQYTYDRSKAAEIRKKIDEISDSIISELINDHQSEYDKALVLHDYLKTTAEYDYSALTYTPSPYHPMPQNVSDSHSIVGALINKKCVCEGFAKAYKLLCEKAGVECYVVSGESHSVSVCGPHAWNIAKINGFYHHIDVTWDNQTGADCGIDIPNYSYFGLSDEECLENHIWNESHYPKCPVAPYNYFKINNSIIDNKNRLLGFLKEKFYFEESPIIFKIKKGSPLENDRACIDNAIRELMNSGKVSIASCRTAVIPGNLVCAVEVNYK